MMTREGAAFLTPKHKGECGIQAPVNNLFILPSPRQTVATLSPSIRRNWEEFVVIYYCCCQLATCFFGSNRVRVAKRRPNKQIAKFQTKTASNRKKFQQILITVIWLWFKFFSASAAGILATCTLGEHKLAARQPKTLRFRFWLT